MLNRITMTGRLVADPELRRTQSGVSVTSFRIANDRDYEDDGSLSKEELRQLRRIHAAAARFQAELQREMEKRHVPTAKRLSAGCRSQKDGEYDALI